MSQNNRIQSLDILRGWSLIFIILFHSSIYNFANIHKLDFSNPPLMIILMSFMALWGGIFIIYSMIVNSFMIAKRNKGNNNSKTLRHLTYVSIIYLGFHYLLNIFLGRWSIDFINNQPDMTVIANVLRGMEHSFPHFTKIFEGSSLSTIALNLLVVSWVLYFLFKNNGEEKKTRNYIILGSLGFIILIFSFLRVSLYSLFTQSVESNNHILSVFYSFTIANPYPLLPYLSYGFFGALIGLMIYNKRRDLLKKIILPIGLLFFIFGFIGMMNFDKTISKPDYFWYFKTNFELALFLLIITGTYFLFENKNKLTDKLSVLKWFSRVSLTIYLLEVFMSEMLRFVVSPIIPEWDQTINGSLLFGCLNILVWIFILYFWRKSNFKYSLEYFWIKLFKNLGKESTKMKFEN